MRKATFSGDFKQDAVHSPSSIGLQANHEKKIQCAAIRSPRCQSN